MWGDSKTTDNLNQLLDEVKCYVKLEKEYLTLDLVEKLSKLFSAIVLGFILMCLGIVVLFYLSFTAIYLISPIVGGLTTAYAIMTLILLILLFCIYKQREKWILIPITQFIANVLLSDETEGAMESNKTKEEEA
ncbi:MAG: phage holin family protein [Bacteroidaceae bacterium]|nr:phage holin family protein [Bacteroidaceae bacterium]